MDDNDDNIVPPPEAPGLDLQCPNCGVEVGEHTLREYGACLHAQGANYYVPNAEIPGGPVRMTVDDDQMMVGAIDVVSGVTDTALGKLPILGFRFYAAGVEPMSTVPTPMYLLVGDNAMMRRTVELVRLRSAEAQQAAGR